MPPPGVTLRRSHQGETFGARRNSSPPVIAPSEDTNRSEDMLRSVVMAALLVAVTAQIYPEVRQYGAPMAACEFAEHAVDGRIDVALPEPKACRYARQTACGNSLAHFTTQ